MPDIEFIGFAGEALETAKSTVRRRIEERRFARAAMFLSSPGSTAEDIDGKPASYLRITTRDDQIAREFIDSVRDLYDVEYVQMKQIHFAGS